MTRLVVLTGTICVSAVVAQAGAPYLNAQYWPKWAYSPLEQLPGKNCTEYDVSGGIDDWNDTGLVSIGSPSDEDECESDGYLNFKYGGPACAGCEGQVFNYTISPSHNWHRRVGSRLS